MRRLALSLFGALVFAVVAQDATAQGVKPRETLNIGVSSREISIAPDFAGTDVTVFGALENADPYLLAVGVYDIVVSLEGPRDFVTVRKKERAAGMWINRHAVTFEYMPESFSMASTKVVDDIGTSLELYTHNVGFPRVKVVPSTFSGRPEELSEFSDAFLALKQRAGLYQSNPGGVSFVSSSLFQATIHIPANIPNGTHTIRAVLFKSGNYLTENELKMHVQKTGLEQEITRAARQTPLLYGTISVLLALVTGWGASIMFRKD